MTGTVVPGQTSDNILHYKTLVPGETSDSILHSKLIEQQF